ncbi:hypothetical protein GOP47_0012974, partial [Adiantum capillus-veneris]
ILVIFPRNYLEEVVHGGSVVHEDSLTASYGTGFEMGMSFHQAALQGMDYADLPYVEDVKSWPALPTMEEIVWDPMDEIEKAVSDGLYIVASKSLNHLYF